MRYIIFDVDDTLYDQTQGFKRAYERLFSEKYAYAQIDPEILCLHSRRHSDTVFEAMRTGKITQEQSGIYRITMAMRDFQIEISEDEAREFQTVYSRCQEEVTLTLDVEALLSELLAQGVGLAVITNGEGPHQRAKMKSLGLERWIRLEHCLVSGDTPYAKPQTEIFRIAEEKLGIKADDEIWFIGDSYASDVVGAKKAGWNAVWFNRRHHKAPQSEYQPDYIVKDVEELSDFLRKLVKQGGKG